MRNTRISAFGRLCSVALLAFAAALLAVSCSEPVAPRKADNSTPTPPPPVIPPAPAPPPPGPGDTSAPTTPGSLVASTDGPFGITVSWQASSDNVGVSAYRVERCQGAACTNFSQVATPTGTSFSDTGLNPATAYAYRVRAGDAAGNLSTYSNTATSTTASAPPPPLATLPAWVNALSVGQWFEIPNTSIRSVDPSPTPAGNTGPRSKIDTWTSIGVDTRTSRVYSLAGGGHSDYAGNEVDMMDLEDPSGNPTWVQLLAPTQAAQVGNCTSYYADDHPASRHSYYGITLNEFGDRFMLFGGVTWCSAGGFDNPVSSYNITANTWSPSSTHADLPASAFFSIAAYTLNPLTGDVYAAASFNYARWTRASGANGAFVILNPSGNGPKGDSTPTAMDTTRGRILYLGGNNPPPDHHLYTISSNSFTTITPTGAVSADVSAVANAQNTALLYVDALDRFLVKLDGAGGTVYQINPTTFEVSQFPTTGGSSIPTTVNGVYNKFRYVPRLRGIIYTPTGNGNAWFLRIIP
jgi:hypothetical protein